MTCGDPACGDGSLLFALEYCIHKELIILKEKFHGMESGENLSYINPNSNGVSYGVDIQRKAVIEDIWGRF